MKFVIEHLERRVWKWCLIEYENISKIVGKENLWITNIKRKNKKLEKIAIIFKERFSDIILNKKLNEKKICVLDPQAEKELSPKEAKNFEYFVFGGILGDHPPKKRTKKELSIFLKNCEKRSLGKKQFPTDNAVAVVKEIINGKKLSELKFKDRLEIKLNEIETVELPFRYLILNGRPFISEKIIKYLKNKKGF